MSLILSMVDLMNDDEYDHYLNNKGIVDSILNYRDKHDQAVSALDYYKYYYQYEKMFKEIFVTILKSIAENEVKLKKEKTNIDYVKIIQGYDIFLSYKKQNTIDFYKLSYEAFNVPELLLHSIAVILADQKINLTKAQRLLKLDDFISLPEEEKQKILSCQVIDIADKIGLFIVKKDSKENIKDYEELFYSRGIEEKIH